MSEFKVYEKTTGKTVKNCFSDGLGNIYQMIQTGRMCDCGCVSEFLNKISPDDFIIVWGRNLYDDNEKKEIQK